MFERRRKIGVAGVAAAAATALLAAGCGSSGSTQHQLVGRLRHGRSGHDRQHQRRRGQLHLPLHGTQCYSVNNYEDFQYLMVRPLYMFGGNSNTSISVNYPLSPANAPVYSNGGKTVVINMKGWKWSDGETVDANSLMLNLNMLEAEKTNFTPAIRPA